MATNKKIGTLLFRIESDTKALKKGMDQTQRSTSKLKKSFSAMIPIMAAAFSVRAISGFLKSVTELYNVQAKAEASLLTALKGREGVQKRLIKQSGELQDITLYGDEETIAAQSMLAQMGLEEAAIKRLIPLVQDMATAKGMDLKGAADLVAKSVGSSTNALSRYGIVIEGAVGSSERLDTAVNALSKAFKGQAEAAAKAGTGGITQLKNALGDVKEALGKALLETGEFNEKASDLAKTMSSIDWEKVFDGMIKGSNKLRDALALSNPLLGQFVALQKLAVEFLPKKAIGGATASAGLNLNDLTPPVTTPTITPKGFGHAPLGKITSISGSVTSDPGLYGAMSQMASIPGAVGGLEPFSEKLKTKIVPDIQESMRDMSVVMQQTFMGAVDAFGQGIQNLAAGNLDLENVFKGILGAFGGFLTQMGKLIVAYGVGMKAFRAAFKTPGGAIIAGLALIAIGSAISGLAARGPAVSGGGGGGGSVGGGLASIPITGTTKIQGRDIVIAYERGSSYTNATT